MLKRVFMEQGPTITKKMKIKLRKKKHYKWNLELHKIQIQSLIQM